MKLKSWIWSGLMLFSLVAGLNAADAQIDAEKIETVDNIPGWEIFKYVKDGTVALENAGDDKALKLSTEVGKKGMMLIAKEPIECDKGGKITFAFTVTGKGSIAGGAYLLDAEGKNIGGVYGVFKDIKVHDEWSDFIDAKNIPTEVKGKVVAKILPYFTIKSGSEVLLKGLNYKITSN